VVYYFDGGHLELRTRWICNDTRNKRDTTSLYWFGSLESIVDCIALDGCDLVLGERPYPPYIG
jgi:hypothetical protein